MPVTLRSRLRVLSGAALIVAAILWTTLAIRVVAALIAGGVDGARGVLHRLLFWGAFFGPLDQDPIVTLSRGYECLFVYLVITWALVEIYRYARSGKR